jgi:hypothetical protein
VIGIFGVAGEGEFMAANGREWTRMKRGSADGLHDLTSGLVPR